MATLEELETFWNIDDVLRANALLDLQDQIEREELKTHGNHSRASR